MNPEEYNDLMEKTALAGQVGQVNQMNQGNNAAQYYVEEKEKSIADAQLEVDVTLDKLYHMLKQDRWIEKGEEQMAWQPLELQERRTLTDEGVEKIMQVMRFYINKENLLSNFSEEQINRIMLTFCLSLNANFFMTYNNLFRQPDFDECKRILETRLREKASIKKYALDIMGKESNEEEIFQDILKDVEYRIEKEISKIREEKRKENLREWEMLFHQLEQMVLATLNRAWRGEERGSLRRHTSISEVLGRQLPPQNPQGGGGRFGWLK